MKFPKITAFAAAAVLALGALTGCGADSGADQPDAEIVTTVYAVYDMAKQLTAGFDSNVRVTLLLTPGGESHSYEPTPADAAAIQRCTVFAYVGGTSEKWADKMITSSREEKVNLKLMDYVEPLTEETVEGMQEHDHDHDDHDDHDGFDGAYHDDLHRKTHDNAQNIEYDEHIWTSPKNADAMLGALHDTIRYVMPEESAKCKANYEKLHAAFTELDQTAQNICSRQKSDTIIVADRFPFRYLTAAYGWKYYAAFPGCSGDTDASAATLSFLIAKVQEMQVKTVFYLENSTKKISDAVCRATGANAVMLQSGNNVSAEDFKAGKHIQDIMAENLRAIGEALC